MVSTIGTQRYFNDAFPEVENSGYVLNMVRKVFTQSFANFAFLLNPAYQKSLAFFAVKTPFLNLF